MARGTLSMRYIKEILRLRFEAKLSQRDISRSIRVSVGSVNQYLARAAQAGIRWLVAQDMATVSSSAATLRNDVFLSGRLLQESAASSFNTSNPPDLPGAPKEGTSTH